VGPALAAASAFAIPLALSASTAPSPLHPKVLAWYKSLRQPFFKPPDWAVPLAWAGIEAGLATAAYRLVKARPSAARTRALVTLGFNITMIGAWSRLFFGRRALATSTVAAAAMVVTGADFVRQARRVDPVAARAGIPFVAWVGFATVLTAAIWGLNRRR
jgi:tryptophan-rich sensory protein